MVIEATVLTDFEKVVRFTVNVDKMRGKCLTSSEISLGSMPWHIELCHRSHIYGDFAEDPSFYVKVDVDVALVSPFNGEKSDFACEAQAIFKLLPNNEENGTPIVKNITKQKFDHRNPSYEFKSFVGWNELLNKYTTEKEATFEIVLSTGPASRELMLEPISSKFLVAVENVDISGQSYAPEIVLRDIRWTIMTERLLDFYKISLMANKDDIHINWATNVTVTITLLSNSKETSRTSTKVYTFDWRNSVKSLEIIEWDEFMDLDNKFVENDAAIFRVELSVAPPKPLWNIDF